MKLDFNQDWYFQVDGNEPERVQLPHDAMLHSKRSPQAKGGSAIGFFEGGKYRYEKRIMLKEDELDKKYTLLFGGVYKNSKVFINGELAGSCDYGYLPFAVALDGKLISGENEIVVTADNSNQPESRWYSGGGIYRPVYLLVQNNKRILPNGIKVKTVGINPARIEVDTKHDGGEICIEVKNSEGMLVASASGDRALIEIPNAFLWDDENPYLYRITVKLVDDGTVVDGETFSYGIRMVECGHNGIMINGKSVLLRGGCIHHDNGILGACEYQESADRKIRILKENGFNAIRSAHNPCSEEILNACDKYGIYVMDETWDMWYRKKNPGDYANKFNQNYKSDIKAIVEKDYNHASVIMYSIGNEVSEPAEDKGVELAKEMVKLFHELDSTRIVTGGFNLMIISNAAKGKAIYKEDGGLNESQSKDMSGMNSTIFNMIASRTGSGMNNSANGKKADKVVSPVLDCLDVAGYNYASGRYKEDLKKHPERLIIGSETFPQDIAKNWEMVKKMPNLVGDFMWTAWDYLGEAGLGAWSYESDAKGFSKPYPWLLADAGVFDILGNPTGEALWAKVIWSKEPLVEMSVRPCNHPNDTLIKAAWRGTNAIPSYSWSNCDGNKTVVEVYANGYKVDLFLNKKRIGSKKIKRNKAEFKIKYQAGVLKAIVYNKMGAEIAQKELSSATGTITPHIISEKETIHKGEIVYLNICMMDENRIVDCNSDQLLNVSVENGELLGFGSANPKTTDSFISGEYRTFHGKALAVVRAYEKGEMIVSVCTENSETKLVLSVNQ